MREAKENPIRRVLSRSVKQSKLPGSNGWTRLMEWTYGLVGGLRVGREVLSCLYGVTMRRMGQIREGAAFSLPEASQTIGYASRALELTKDREQRGTLHFWLGQLHCLRSQLRRLEQEGEMRRAHSHFVQAEQQGHGEAGECGQIIWELLGKEIACPVEREKEPSTTPMEERVSLATPHLEQGRLAMQTGNLLQAQLAFKRASEIAPLDLGCEDRWVVATLLIQAQQAIEAESRSWSQQCLKDAVTFCEPLAGEGEKKSWAKVTKQLAEQGDLLEELAEAYRQIAERRLSDWLHHFEGQETQLPRRLLVSFENAALHYGFALSSPYTIVERALDHYIDVMRKLSALYWHGRDYSSVINIAQQIISYLPQRKQGASAYFHSVLAHAYVGMAEQSQDEAMGQVLRVKAEEHAHRAIREDPAAEQRHHLGPEELLKHPDPDMIFTGKIQR